MKSPSLSTPLFEFPLLASIHAIVLGSLLPLLFDRYYRPCIPFRLGGMFVCAGEMVLVTGFLLHPRSSLCADGGLMVMAGLLLAGVTFRVSTSVFLYWLSLLMSSAMGYVLGTILMRPVIDPIPFSMIAAHALIGAGSGLFPLFWIESGEARGNLLSYVMAGFVGVSLFFVLEKTVITNTMEVLASSILALGLSGVSWNGRVLIFVFAIFSGIIIWSGRLYPGQWISVWGILLIFGAYAGYFLKREPSYSLSGPEGTETV